MNRRDVVKALFGGTGQVIAWTKERKPWHPRERHQNEMLYRGPLMIPEHIVTACAEPDIRSRTGSINPKKLIMCFDERNRSTEPALLKWRFRCPIPGSRCMVGEIQRGSDGVYRIIAFAAATPKHYREAQDILAWKMRPANEQKRIGESAHGRGEQIMPPLIGVG